jgi:hypothetical protein
MTAYYTVFRYINGRIDSRTYHLSKELTYENAVPKEALKQNPRNRWHVMLYPAAIEKMEALLVGETLRVCWQEYNPDFDTEHILIMREEDSL